MPTSMRSLVLCFFSASLVGACAAPAADDADARDDVGQSEDALKSAVTVPEGTYLARGMLRVANELSADELRSALKISKTLAAKLVDARGADGFHSLAELDAIVGTGPVFFAKLQAHAEQNGFVGACGDGRVETGLEQCDDGNTASNDGCSDTCKPESLVEDTSSPAESNNNHISGAIDMGNFRTASGKAQSSNWGADVDWWTFTVDAQKRVRINFHVDGGNIHSSICPGGASHALGRSELRRADWSLIDSTPSTSIFNPDNWDWDLDLPAGRYYVSISSVYSRCIGGTAYIGDWYTITVDR